jgi:hypothetical protein
VSSKEGWRHRLHLGILHKIPQVRASAQEGALPYPGLRTNSRSPGSIGMGRALYFVPTVIRREASGLAPGLEKYITGNLSAGVCKVGSTLRTVSPEEVSAESRAIAACLAAWSFGSNSRVAHASVCMYALLDASADQLRGTCDRSLWTGRGSPIPQALDRRRPRKKGRRVSDGAVNPRWSGSSVSFRLARTRPGRDWGALQRGGGDGADIAAESGVGAGKAAAGGID